MDDAKVYGYAILFFGFWNAVNDPLFWVAIPSYVLMYFTVNHWMLLFGYALTTLALSGLFLFDPVLLGDVADEDFIKTGKHKQGMYSSIYGFFYTLAYSLAIFVLTYLLEFFEYDGKADFQSAYTIQGIRIISSIVPMVAVVLCVFILKFYPLKGKKLRDLRFKLAGIYGADILEEDGLLEKYREMQMENCDKEVDEGLGSGF